MWEVLRKRRCIKRFRTCVGTKSEKEAQIQSKVLSKSLCESRLRSNSDYHYCHLLRPLDPQISKPTEHPSHYHFHPVTHQYPKPSDHHQSTTAISVSSHSSSKSQTDNSNRQSRQFPPNTRITSLLHRPIARSRSCRTIPRRSRARRDRSNQIRGNKTRSLRQLAVNRSLSLDARSERHDGGQSRRRLLASARLSVCFRRVEDRVTSMAG